MAVGAIQKQWRVSQAGFDGFLGRLDSDRESAGHKYELLRSKLINYFDWRGCPFPEEHADEALNRVMKKVEAGEQFLDVSIYVFGVARMMLREIGRAEERQRSALSQLPVIHPVASESDESEQRARCLGLCLESLSDQDRRLITRYYEGEGPSKIIRRRELAESLGLEINALRIRACRLRDKLQVGMKRCLAGRKI